MEKISLQKGHIKWEMPLEQCEAMIARSQASINLAKENAELRKIIAGLEKKIADYKLGTREKETLMQMIIGMAVRQYDYDPSTKKNAAPATIQSELKSLRISLSVDAIRKWLQKAKIFLPINPQKT